MDRPWSGRRGWLATVALLIGAAAALLGSEMRSGGVQIGRAQQPDDPALLRELAERELSPPPPPLGGLIGKPQRAHLFPGALPPDLPVDVPLPPDSRLIGSAVRPGPPTGQNIEVVLDIPGAPGDIVAFYTAALTAAGWSTPVNNGPPPGGFLPQPVTSRTFCQTENGPFINLSVFATGTEFNTEFNDVRLNILTGIPGPCGAPGRPPFPPGADLLPALAPPPGVALQSSGNRGFPGVWSADATIADTDLSSAELAAFYAQQLVAVGWTQQDGRSDGPLAWSTWTVPAEGSWQGFLYVREGAAPKQRILHIEVASDEALTFPK